ncbi:DUF3363 domain-containing protein [Bradyrhizobium elkanii]|nr:DUF3363 domain-containing protein [Bradyrhizobium elkanii]
MGLVEQAGPGRRRIGEEFRGRAQWMGERGDNIKTTHRELAAAGIAQSDDQYTDLRSGPRPRLVGRVVGEGLPDELIECHYVVLDGSTGGRTTLCRDRYPLSPR